MAGYRAFYVVSDGNFRNSVSFDCVDDDAAIEKVQQLPGHQNIELWSGHRVIATLDHKSEL